jgi:sporulation protein YlmC with PRC-barrel domain
MSMDLVHELLDQPVVDRNGRPMGRVDGIVLDVRDDAPPRVVSIAIGPAVLGERLHRTVGRWIRGIEVACGVAEGRPVEIALTDIAVVNGRVHADVAAGDTAALAVEQRVRGWIHRVPGA